MTDSQKEELFFKQKELLDTFLSSGAITVAQYEKSLGDLAEKMGMKGYADTDKKAKTVPVFLCDNISVNEAGHLCFAGHDTVSLAAQYGTPLYIMDESRIRRNCRMYSAAFEEFFPAGSRPLFASKAASFKQLCRIMASEGMGIDVVSCGEIYTAYCAGFDLENAYFHGSNKTDEDIRFAMDHGVGYFAADSAEEIKVIESEASKRGIVQKILLRLTPGIDPHTYAAVNTGMVDSKFGSAIETGRAEEITLFALSQPHIELAGFHCHVGSQVFAEDVFERAVVVMLEFIAHIYGKYGYMAKQLNLGGGFGVRYADTDPIVDIPKKLESIANTLKDTCRRLGIAVPCFFMEPGRSIVADAGMTLYSVGAVKSIPGYKTYVSVDGGMGDNPRFALYRSKYSCYIANRMAEARDLECSLVGRCCESGDILQENVRFPGSVCRGDIAAVCTTGAYNYSMASNYNRLPRPAVVMLSGEEKYIAVKRESLDDIISLDI